MGYAERAKRVQWATAKRQKVVIGYPVGGSVTVAFHTSMLRLLGQELPKGDARLLSQITHSQGLYVGDNRDLVVLRFLDSDADWLLQIDTDIEFPGTLLEDMLRIAGDDKKVLAASVPLGNAPTCGYMRTERPGIWSPIPQIIGDVMEVDGVATACCLVHRSVYMDIAAKHGQCWHHHIYIPCRPEDKPAPTDFKYISQGEDLAFSLRAREVGHRIWVCYVPGLKHHKTRALSHDEDRQAAMIGEDPGVGELVQEGAA